MPRSFFSVSYISRRQKLNVNEKVYILVHWQDLRCSLMVRQRVLRNDGKRKETRREVEVDRFDLHPSPLCLPWKVCLSHASKHLRATWSRLFGSQRFARRQSLIFLGAEKGERKNNPIYSFLIWFFIRYGKPKSGTIRSFSLVVLA